MANISQVKLPDDSVYTIKDANAAPLDSPALTGTPTAPTATAGTNTDQIATTKFVTNALTTNSIYYGECSTSASSSGKTVTISGITALTTGLCIRVKFANAQSYDGTPTLNLNSLGAKNIRSRGTTNAAKYEWLAGEVIDFVYDGSGWLMVNGGIATTTYYGYTKLATSATSTSTALALTPASLNNFSQNTIANAPVYSKSATYAVGDRVRYSYSIWECNTAITTAEAWNATHWTELPSLQEQIDNIPAWAKASTKPSYTAAEVGAVPNPLTINAIINTPDNGVVDPELNSIEFTDLISNTVGALTACVYRDGMTSISLGVHNLSNESVPLSSYFSISISKNGDVVYSVPAPGSFRSAIGAVDSSAIPTKVSDLNNDSGFLTASTGVSGIKGNSESTYRKGDVNITPANIGAYTTGETNTAIETRLAPTDMSSHFTINTSLSAAMQSKINIQQAKRFGSMMAVCVRLDAGFSGSGAILFYMDDDVKPAQLAYVVPIFFNSSGKINTEGAIWIENTHIDQVRYYGDTLSANSYFTIIYGLN